MAKAERVSEPTMDEILASIRKIIAEEPVSRKAVNGASGASERGDDHGFPAPRASLDDILGMADSPSQGAAAHAQPDVQGKAEAQPVPASAAKSADSAEQLKAASEPARPFFPSPAASKPAAGAGSDHGAPGGAARAEGVRSVDFGSIVPGRPPSEPTAAEDGDRRQIPGRLPEWLSRPGASPSGPQLPAPAPNPAETRSVPAAEPANKADRKPEPAAKAIGPDPSFTTVVVPSASAPQPSPGVTGAQPATSTAGKDAAQTGSGPSVPAARQDAGEKADARAGAAHAASEGKAVAPDVKTVAPDVKTAAASGSGAPGAKPAATAAPAAGPLPAAAQAAQTQPSRAATASPNPSAGLSGGAAAAPSPAAPRSTGAEKSAAMPVTVPEAASPVSKPVVLDRSKAVKPGASTDLVASMPPAGGIRTLDDTIIELLRPMIRQWLDDNMPRMVEKALRIELAASLQAASESKSDPSKH